MAQGNDPTDQQGPTKNAKAFCDNMELEIRVRNAIAEIAKKLNRSNLSAKDGQKYAELLKKAYEHLETVEEALIGKSKCNASAGEGSINKAEPSASDVTADLNNQQG